MATNLSSYKLRSFLFNGTDISFLLSQVTFRPLFYLDGTPVINWDGSTAIYDINHKLLYDPLHPSDYGISGTGQIAAANAISVFGSSYASLTDASGLRNVSGLSNNLVQDQNHWGQADTPFTRIAKADFTHYLKAYAPEASGASYGKNFDGTVKTYNSDGVKVTPDARPMKTDYSTTVDANGNVTQHSVVDYTPRMISLLTTTGGVTFEKDHGKIVFSNGLAQVADWGMLSSNQYGQIDYQNRDGVTAQLDSYGHLVKDENGVVQTINNHDANGVSHPEQFIGSINPGVAPANGWFALFGQFFDHGLDFVGKGGQTDNGKVTTIKIALSPTDPLYVAPAFPGDPNAVTSMTVTRATVSGVDKNGDPTYINHDSPYIDQSQTYGSNAQITSLLREWVSTDEGKTYHAGTNLFNGTTSAAWTNAKGETTHETLPTVNELRAQLTATGRADLSWDDISNFRNRDASGHIATGASAGTSGASLLLDMNPHFDSAHILQSTLDAINSYKKFDSTHLLAFDSNGNIPLYPGSVTSLFDFIDFSTFNPNSNDATLNSLVGELLLESIGDHYVAGDGRVNENIGLTAIHHVWHEEHNYQVDNLEQAIAAQDAKLFATGDKTHQTLHDWQIAVTDTATGKPYQDANGNFLTSADGSINWDSDKIFNAAKLTVEMEYQHVAVDQYARSVTPDLPEFVGYNTNLNGGITDEFAQVGFRFGHSTIRETIDTIDPEGGLTGKIMSLTLKDSFLNPSLFASVGAGSIALGMTHQQMNAVDEFLTPALNQGLLGQPLDLGAINIARGRDMGMPTINDFRTAIGFKAYSNWAEFGQNMKYKENLVGFIAAYSFDGDLDKATALMNAYNHKSSDIKYGYTFSSAMDFMQHDQGIAHVDAWLGGLAEKCVLGGLLGETFNAVFLDQIERLMDGDRYYYLYRLVDQQFGEGIINEQFKDIVERNTGVTHLNGNVFAYADQYYDMGVHSSDNSLVADRLEHKYGDIIDASHIGIFTDGTTSEGVDATNDNGSIIQVGSQQYILDIRPELNGSEQNLDGTPVSGANSNEVLVGTAYNDIIYMQGGDDTAYGDGGNDMIYGGDGMDKLYGGDGNDTLYGGEGPDVIDGGAGNDLIYGEGSGTAMNGTDQLIGGDGNDTIYGGNGIDKISGERGDDVIYGEGDTDPFTHGGDGNDYIDGSTSGDLLYGDNGDDLLVGGADQDVLTGGDGDDILRPGPPSAAAIANGPDEVVGGNGTTDTGFDIMDLSDWAKSNTGTTIDFATQTAPQNNAAAGNDFPAWFQIDGIIATANNDTIIGDDASNWLIGGSGNDTITGGAGNDVIVGNRIRLDSLIGTYKVLDSDGMTWIPASYEYSVDGATNRAGTANEAATLQSNGLLDAAGTAAFGKHFTDMLSTAMFKDLVLGNDTLAGGTGTGNDVVVFSGSSADYRFERIMSAQGAEAYRVTDLVGNDGSDLVVGITKFQFSNGMVTAADMSVDSGAVDIIGYSINSANSTTTLIAQDTVSAAALRTGNNPAGSLVNQIGNGLAYQWQILDGSIWKDILNATSAQYNAPTDSVAHSYRVTAYYIDATSTVHTFISPEMALLGSSKSDIITGSSQNEFLIGLADNDSLVGGGGNDTFDGGLGIDTLAGGSGDDTYVVDTTTDTIIENSGGGKDTVKSSLTFSLLGANVLSAEIENLTLTGTAAINATGNALNNILIGNSANNILTGDAGNDTLDGGTGTDTLVGGSGDDVYIVDTSTDTITEAVNGGVDTVMSSTTFSLATIANVENLTLTGQANINATGNTSDNILIGNDGDNSLSGGGGNDTFVGGLGNDTLTGASGNDIFRVTAGVDTLTDYGNGSDTLIISAGATVNATVYGNMTVLPGELDNSGTANINANGKVINLTAATGVNGYGITNSSTTGSSVIGSKYADTLSGGAGNDTLNGGEGNDIITSGAGADSMIGGAGDDTFNVTGSTADLISDLGVGNDILKVAANASVLATLGNHWTATNATSNLGTTSINANGKTLDLTVVDISAGNRGYTITNSTITGSSVLGSGLADTITGGTGNDTLNGGAGNDSITGGVGDDTLTGGAGQDTFNVDLGSDRVTDLSGTTATTADILKVAAIAKADASLSADWIATNATSNFGIANINANGFAVNLAAAATTTGNRGYTITNTGAAKTIIGSGLADTITGTSSAESINGGAGNDTIIGFNAGDMVDGGLGTDAIQLTSSFDNIASDAQIINIETITAAGLLSGITINLANQSETIAIIGSGYADIITGGSGNNSITGGGGNDALTGGAGQDTFNVDLGIDTISDLSGTGSNADILKVAAGATAKATLSAAWTATSATANTGGSASINAAGFAVNLAAATGSNGYTITTNDTATNIVGSSFSDTITGGSGNNTINGGAGNDFITGGGGNDALTGGAGQDTFNVDLGTDTISDLSGTGTNADILLVASAAIANATVTAAWTATNATSNLGTATINANGFAVNLASAATTTGNYGYTINTNNTATNIVASSLDDTITGGIGNDSINGGAGNDTINGGAGNDVLTGGVGKDTLTGGAGQDTFNVDSGVDTVTDLSGTTATTADILKVSEFANTFATLTAAWTATNATSNLGTATINANGFAVNLASAATTTGNYGYTINTNNTATNIVASSLDDTITGGAGNDTINGGAGNDVLTGGVGSDTFVFNTALNETTNLDRITDFVSGVDKLRLSASIFTAFTNAAGQFSEVNNHNANSTALIIHDTATGGLYYNADGSGNGAAVEIAVVGVGHIANTDIIVG